MNEVSMSGAHDPLAVAVEPQKDRPTDRLTRKEPAAAGLLRLLAADVAAARDELAAASNGEASQAIHRTRRSLKRARTLLRLLRPALGEEGATLAGHLRAAARALSASRDATVLALTAEDLAPDVDDETAHRLLATLAARAKLQAERSAHSQSVLSEARDHIEAAGAEIARLSCGEDVESVVLARAAKLYRRVRQGWRAAEGQPDATNLHEWRKRVKDRLHLVRVFRARWPEPSRGRAGQLDRLGEILGEDHDLAVLADALPQRSTAAPTLRERIEARRLELERKAFALAGKLFAKKARRVKRAWLGSEG